MHIPEEVQKREQHHKLALHAKIGYLVGYQLTNIYHIWISQDEEVWPEKDVIFDKNTFFDPWELEKPVSEVITTMEVPKLSTEPLEGLILEDFKSD